VTGIDSLTGTGNANATGSYGADSLSIIGGRLAKAFPNGAAREAWAKDLPGKAGKLTPDAPTALPQLADAVKKGDFLSAARILQDQPALERFLPVTASNQRGANQTNSGGIVPPPGIYGAHLPHRAAPATLPQGVEAAQAGTAPMPAKDLQQLLDFAREMQAEPPQGSPQNYRVHERFDVNAWSKPGPVNCHGETGARASFPMPLDKFNALLFRPEPGPKDAASPRQQQILQWLLGSPNAKAVYNALIGKDPLLGAMTEEDRLYLIQALSPRQRQILQWLPGSPNAKAVYDALKGKDRLLGAMTEADRRYLIEALSPRQQQIQQWLQGSPNAKAVYDALNGKSPLGTVTLANQRDLIDGFLPNWDLQGLVRNDRDLKIMLAGRWVAFAAKLLKDPPAGGQDPRVLAKNIAVSVSNEFRDDKAALAKALQGLEPEEGALFFHALGSEPMVSGPRWRVLTALNAEAPSPTTRAIVQNIYTETVAGEVAGLGMQRNASSFRHELAWAVAREWHPETDAAAVQKRNADVSRLEGLMSNRADGRVSAGQMLLFMGTADQRIAVLEAVRFSPEITAGTLENWNGEPTNNPVVAKALAEHIVPWDYPNRVAEIVRFAGIVQTERGRELLYGVPGSGVPLEAIQQAREGLLSHPEIAAETLRNPPQPDVSHGKNPWFVGSAWCNPAVIRPIAQANAASVASDTPTALGLGTHAENFVGLAMGQKSICHPA
jgi:hypothetical protein